jgi:hypothetical protein
MSANAWLQVATVSGLRRKSPRDAARSSAFAIDGACAADRASVRARSTNGKASSIRPSTHNVRASQTLLAALSESDAVKSAAALRQRRVQLQIGLGNALIWAKGHITRRKRLSRAAKTLSCWHE